jgi:hypothetical protein
MTNNLGWLDYDQVINGQMEYAHVGGIGPEWELDGAGVGLLNGDGQPAFLMRNTGNVTNGLLEVGEVVNGQVSFTAVGGVGPEWTFEGVGNLLGHGQADFLMHNTAGLLEVGEVANNVAQFTQIGGMGAEWQFAGTGNFLGDGRTGFLIRNTGTVAPGLLEVGEEVNGSLTFTPVGGIGSEWKIVGTGDYLGAGHPGFLIENTGNVANGLLEVGEVSGGHISFTQVGGLGSEWQFVGSGNYIDTSKADFLIRNTGNVANGLLEVGSITGSAASYTQVGGVGSEWNFHTSNIAVTP